MHWISVRFYEMGDSSGWSPLLLAAKNGHLDLYYSSGWSPLLLAAKNGHLDLVKIFLDNNARVDVFDQVRDNQNIVLFSFSLHI